MNEFKMGRAARRVAAPFADSEIGKVVMETTHDNLSLEDRIVKEQ